MNPSQSDKPTFVEHPKVTTFHLHRLAYIYVRQSSLKQVQQNQESQMYQYRLQQRALELGWAKDRIRVIDSDLGYSGQDAELRVGFQELVAEISLGHVGIVFGYEVSRLARNNRDWYLLLDLAAMFGTLIADSDGLYDPRSYNDRLLLGLYIIYNLGRVRCHSLSLPSGELSLQVIVCRQLVQMIHRSKIILNQPLDLLHQDELTPISSNRCLHHSQRW